MKKSRSYAKKQNHAKQVMLRARFPRARRSVDLYSGQTPHYFKRQLQDGILYTNGLGSITCRDATGALCSWFNNSPLNTDQGGVAATYQFGMSIAPQLVDVQDYTQFTALFERYELLKCEVRIQTVMGDSYDVVASQLPYIYSAPDYTDATAPVNQQTIQQFQAVEEQVISADKSFCRSFHPVPSAQMFISAVATGYGTPSAPRWMDCLYPTIPHYGMKFYLRNWIGSAINLGNALRIQPTLWFRVKETH